MIKNYLLGITAIAAFLHIACNNGENTSGKEQVKLTPKDTTGTYYTDRTVIADCYLMQDSTLSKQSIKLYVGDSLAVDQDYYAEIFKNDWHQHVYKVSCKHGDEVVQGFLLEENLALPPLKISTSRNLIFTHRYAKKENQFMLRCVLADNQFKSINSFEIAANGGQGSYQDADGRTVQEVYSHFVMLTNTDSKGLDGSLHTIIIDESMDACGYTNGVLYLSLNAEDDLKLIVNTTSSVDGGVYASYNEVVFPTQKGGLPNKIIQRMMEIEDASEANVDSVNDYGQMFDKEGNLIPETPEKYDFDSLVVAYTWKKNKGIVKVDTLAKYHDVR